MRHPTFLERASQLRHYREHFTMLFSDLPPAGAGPLRWFGPGAGLSEAELGQEAARWSRAQPPSRASLAALTGVGRGPAPAPGGAAPQGGGTRPRRVTAALKYPPQDGAAGARWTDAEAFADRTPANAWRSAGEAAAPQVGSDRAAQEALTPAEPARPLDFAPSAELTAEQINLLMDLSAESQRERAALETETAPAEQRLGAPATDPSGQDQATPPAANINPKTGQLSFKELMSMATQQEAGADRTRTAAPAPQAQPRHRSIRPLPSPRGPNRSAPHRPRRLQPRRTPLYQRRIGGIRG